MRGRLQRGMLSMGVVALVVCAQATSFMHTALFHHRRCAEHGTFVHADSRGLADSAEPISTDAGMHAMLRAVDAENEAHEHCGLTTTHSIVVTLRASMLLGVALPPAETASAPPSAVAFITRNVLVDAPKQGPPLSHV